MPSIILLYHETCFIQKDIKGYIMLMYVMYQRIAWHGQLVTHASELVFRLEN